MFNDTAIRILKTFLPVTVLGVSVVISRERLSTPGMAKRSYEIPDELKVQCNNGVYSSRWGQFVKPSLWQLGRWKSGIIPDHSCIPKSQEELDANLPVVPVNLSATPPEELQVTWIGHATMLVQFEGITLLTDPVFEMTCGPQFPILSSLGYRRFRRAACSIDDLKQLDAVLISHNHYDHLESTAVTKICKKFPEVTWFVASGTKAWFEGHVGPDVNVVELSWWGETKVKINGKEMKFVCLPSQHWCQRGIRDMNKCLWCSWAVIGQKTSFYFAGDTGYYETLFKTIGNMYGPFSLAAIPIGAYEPRELLKFQHVNPEEAVKIHEDIRSKQSVGMHWGTFCLTNEFYLEPPRKVAEEMKERKHDPKSFISLCHGETWVVGNEREDPPFMKY